MAARPSAGIVAQQNIQVSATVSLASGVTALVAGAPTAHPIRVTLLGLALAFFALKVADVRWLRLAPGWRPLCAFTVCVLLLHADVLRRNHLVTTDVWPDAVLVAFSAGAVALAAPWARGVPGWLGAVIGEPGAEPGEVGDRLGGGSDAALT